MNRKYLVQNLGCKANSADSQHLETELQARGWTRANSEQEPSLIIVNSCTVTDEADRQSRAAIKKQAAQFPQARTVVTGCGAEVDPQGFAQVPGVQWVVGNQDKHRLIELLEKADAEQSPPGVLGGVSSYSELTSRHPMDREWPEGEAVFTSGGSDSCGSHTRAFLKVQEGCNAFCTYCIIPYGRGPSRAVPAEEIVRRVNDLVSGGTREVVLAAVNLGDYPPNVETLVEHLLRETKIERIRLGSLDPVEITPRLLEILGSEPRLCPHLHVSLQSPDAKVLRGMKRKYSTPEVTRTLEAIQAVSQKIPGGVFVGMDLIAGFPGETLEQFEWTLKYLESVPWSRLHVFPYSERAGTPATKISGAVPQSERVRRARLLRELSLKRVREHYQAALNSSQGLIKGVLLESGRARGPGDPVGTRSWRTGTTPGYLKVLVPESSVSSTQRNHLIDVRPQTVTFDAASGDAALVSAPCT